MAKNQNAKKSRGTQQFSNRRNCANDRGAAKGSQTYDSQYNRSANMADKRERWNVSEKSRAVPYNDKSWYSKYGDLKTNFANFNFRVPVGSENYWNYQYPEPDDDRFPGVMSLFFHPAFGDSVDGEVSPLNLAATRLYQFTRFENNGSSVYDRGDLMLYYLAMDSTYMCHAWMRRLYGLLNTYSNMNRYVPRALITANRVDFNDLHQHIADFRGFINEYAHKLSVLPVPNSISYINRHVWMADNVFVDQDSVKCQFYQFVPFYFCQFGIETEGEHVGEPYLNYIRPSYGGLLRYSDIKDLANSLIDPLIAEEDFNLIGSDVIKAFGTNGLYRVESIPDEYRTLPVYSEEVLDQIQNAVATGNPACVVDPQSGVTPDNRGHAIYWDKDTNELVPCYKTWLPFDTTQTYRLWGAPFKGNKLINFRRNDIDHDDIMVATRLTNTVVNQVKVSGEYYVMTLKGVGSEVISSMVVYFYTDADTGVWRLGQSQPMYYGIPCVEAFPKYDASDTIDIVYDKINAAGLYASKASRETARQLTNIEYFDRHPAVVTYWMYARVGINGDAEPVLQGFDWNTHDIGVKTLRRLGDVDNYAFFTPEDLRNLSEVALLSEFYVPLTASGALAMSNG